MSMAFDQVARAALEGGDTKKSQAFALLSAMIRIHLRDTERGPAFGPEGAGNGLRTLMPEDLVGEQTTVLSALIPSIENPVLRARIADIAWTNNRRDGNAAKAAIDAYCTAASAILAAELTSPYSMPPALNALSLVRRAAQIEHQTTKKSQEPTHSAQLTSVFEAAYQASRVPDQVGIYLRAADLAMAHRFKTTGEVAADSEIMLANLPAGKFMAAAHSLWHLVISLCERAGDKEARQRCLLGAVDYDLGIPLVEAAVRHLLTANGVDTGKIRDDTTEEDYSLSKLFERFRPKIDEIFGPGLAAEIDQLFNTRPGPALRHEMAHGQITGAECFGQDVYYACWLMFSMCVLLVAHAWDQYLAPELSAIAGMLDAGSEPAA
jgi:hypothetical protein